MPDCRRIRIVLRMLYEAVFTLLLLYFASILFLGELPGVLVVAGLLLLFVLSYAIREWAPTHILILVLHLLLLGAIYLLPVSLGLRILLMLIQGYLTISGLVYAYKGAVIKPLNDIPWPSFVTCTLIYLLSIVTHLSALTVRTYIITILLLIIYYMLVYAEGLTEYIDSARNVSGLPLKRMMHTNTSIIGIIIFILIAGLFAGYIFGNDTLADAIGDAINWLVQTAFQKLLLLIRFIGKLLTWMLGRDDIKPEFADGELTNGGPITGWGLIVEIFLSIVLLAAVSILIYLLMRKLIRILLKPRIYTGDLIEEAEKEKTILREKSRGPKRIFHTSTLMEKARRLYKRRILSYRDEIKLTQNATCRDIEQEIGEKTQEDVHELTELYAELRYGGQEADKIIVQKMRQLADK